MPLAERVLAPLLKERGWGEVILANEHFTIFSRTIIIVIKELNFHPVVLSTTPVFLSAVAHYLFS